MFTANAQFEKENLSFGGGAGIYVYAGVSKPFTINLRGNYNMSEKTSVTVNFNYHLPSSYAGTEYANASSSVVTPYQIEVPVTYNVNMFNLNANFHYTFVHENDDPFSMYAIAGAGITMATLSSVPGAYDKSVYHLSSSSSASQAFTGFIIDAGIGANLNFDRLNVFAEPKIGFPATKVNTTSVENPIPYHVSFLVGVRYNIFD